MFAVDELRNQVQFSSENTATNCRKQSPRLRLHPLPPPPARKLLRPQTATSIVVEFLDFDVFLNGVGVLIAIDQTAVGGNVDALELEFYALVSSPAPRFFSSLDTSTSFIPNSH